MFKQPQTVRSSVLSFLFLALRPSTPWKTCFSSEPLFRSINSQSHCRQLLSIYPLLCLAASSPLLFSFLLCLSLFLSLSADGEMAELPGWTMALLHCAPLLPSRLSLIPTFLPPLCEGRARCLSSPPPSLGGWCCLPFSLLPSLSLSLSLSHTHTHTQGCCLCPPHLFFTHPTSFLFPPLPPTSSLQPQLSSVHVYAQQDAALLHINAHTPRGDGDVE